VHIKDQDPWVTFGTALIPDVTGENRADFYGKVLELNAQLNGAHLGKQEDKLVLVKEELKRDIDQASFYENLNIFNEAHRVAYPKLLEEAENLGVHFSSFEKDENLPSLLSEVLEKKD
jgi:hypothetical protein